MTRFLLVLVALTGAAPAAAQTLTLDEALEIARERNPEYRKALNDLGAAGVEARAGWGAFLPNLSASLSFSGNTATRVTGEDDFGRPVDLPSPVDFRSSSASQGLSASMTLFDGFRTVRNARAAARGRDAAAAGVRASAARVEADVTRTFLTALRERQLIALEEQLLASARSQLAVTERRFRVAGADQTDVLGAQVSVAEQEQALSRQQGAADKAVLALRAIMGVEEDITMVPVGEPPAVWDPAGLDTERLLAEGLVQNPTLARLEASAAAADARAGAARGARWWPTIRASAGLSRSIQLSSFEALGELNPQNRFFGFSLSVDVPIFSRFQTSAQIARADATRDNAEEDLRAARLQLEADIRSALIDLRNAHDAVVLADRGAELARRRLDLAQQRYQLGAFDYSQLQLVIDQTARAERNAITARFQFADADVVLEQLVGGPVRP